MKRTDLKQWLAIHSLVFFSACGGMQDDFGDKNESALISTEFPAQTAPALGGGRKPEPQPERGPACKFSGPCWDQFNDCLRDVRVERNACNDQCAEDTIEIDPLPDGSPPPERQQCYDGCHANVYEPGRLDCVNTRDACVATACAALGIDDGG